MFFAVTLCIYFWGGFFSPTTFHAVWARHTEREGLLASVLNLFHLWALRLKWIRLTVGPWIENIPSSFHSVYDDLSVSSFYENPVSFIFKCLI